MSTLLVDIARATALFSVSILLLSLAAVCFVGARNLAQPAPPPAPKKPIAITEGQK